MKNTPEIKMLLKISSGVFVFSLAVFWLAQRNGPLNLQSQDSSAAQTVPCAQETLSSIGQITFTSAQSQYSAQVKCLLPGSLLYLNENRFTFFSTPTILQGKQVAYIQTDNVSLKAEHQLSWQAQITRAADVYVFYRKIPGQTVPGWLSAYTKVTTDSYADLQPFLLRKNDQGLIGLYDIYQKSVTTASTVVFGEPFSSTGEAFSMYIVGVAPRVSQSPLPSVQAQKGIWISQQEISVLPTTGQTWSDMVAIANGNIGTANLSDLNSSHPENTIGLVLVAVRTNNDALKQKAAAALVSAIGTENNPDSLCASSKLGARGLSVGRNVLGYVVAADILNFRKGGYDPNGQGTRFEQWVDVIRHRKNCDSNGAAALTTSIMDEPTTTSNGNEMTLASRVAAAGYLGDTADADKVWIDFRRYAGDASVGPNFVANSYSGRWKPVANPYVGINPKGAHCAGISSSYPADGVLPNDQGRGGDCPTSPNSAPAYTAYPWEGLQGAYAQAVILARMGYKDPSGKDAWHVSDNALLRGVQYQWYLQSTFGGSWYDAGRAAWVKHLAYHIYGYKPANYNPDGGGRNMDWTQWTHQ